MAAPDGEGGSPAVFVWSANAERRQLMPSQRAIAALAMMPYLEAEAKERREATQGRPSKLALNSEQVSEPRAFSHAGRAAEEAGRLAGVGHALIYQAKALAKTLAKVSERVMRQAMRQQRNEWSAAVGNEREADFQAAVIELANLCGYLTYHPYDSRRNTAGWPDLALVKPPRLLLVELKTTRGRLCPEQRVWLTTLAQCPGVEVAVWRPRDWPAIEAALIHGAPLPPLATMAL